MVPAASSGAASPPRAVELHGVPVAHAVVAQSVRSQVTDLQSGKLPCEFTEGHPGRRENKFAESDVSVTSAVTV